MGQLEGFMMMSLVCDVPMSANFVHGFVTSVKDMGISSEQAAVSLFTE